MEKVLDLSNLTKEKVEKIAEEKFKAIKLQDDLYILPGNLASTENICEELVDVSMISERALERLKAFEVSSKDAITINCEAELDNNKKVMEVINLTTGDAIEFDVISELNHDEREKLVNTIASIYKELKVIVTYYLPYDYCGLKELIMK